MRAEKYVVSTTVKGITRSKIWDPTRPMPVDIRAKWFLERTGETLRVRASDGKVSYEVGSGSMKLPNELKLRVVPSNHISPPYQLPEGLDPDANAKQLQLLAFAGVGRGIVSCQPVHGAYVAFTRKQPVFTLYLNEKGYQIKPLLDGVKFKLKRQKPISGPVGEEWTVTPEQLYGASVIRGSHWWRFNLVPTAEHLEDGPDEEALRQGESVALNRALKVLLAVFAAFSIAVYFVPRPPKVVEEIKEEPIVRFVAPPKPKEPEKVVVAPITSVEEKTETKAPPKPDAAPVKGETEEKVAKKAPEKPHPAQPAPDPKVAAAATAAQKLKMLRAALGGATLAPTTAGKPTRSAQTSGIFTGGDAPLSPTDIKPTYSADNTKVGAVGGGYERGEHASVGGKGSSFVSVDVGGPTVEEGLSKEEVGAVIHKHTDEIRYCHETALLYHPNLEGKLMVAFAIGPTGRVENPTVQSSTLPDKTLEECIMKRLASWQFPRPKGGIHVNVSYPFLFKTLGGD